MDENTYEGRYDIIPSHPIPLEPPGVDNRQGVTGTGGSSNRYEGESGVESRRGVTGTGNYGNDRSEGRYGAGNSRNRYDGDSEYSETNIGYVHPPFENRSSNRGYSRNYGRRAQHVRSAYDGNIHSRYHEPEIGFASTQGEGHHRHSGEQQSQSGSISGLSSGSIESVIARAVENPQEIMGIVQTVLNQLKGNNMSQDALGTAALAALVSNKGAEGLGGLGSGVLGGALGALLLGALGRGGILGGGAGLGAAGPILSELEIQNAVSTIKDHVGNVKGDVAQLFAEHQQAEVIKGVDDKLANMHAHINSQVGHLAEKIEGVQSFLAMQQKDVEIESLREKTRVYAEELNNQKLVNMFRESKDHVNVSIRESHDSIHSTIKAILPLLVPAAAGGGNSISTDRVTQIVNALASLGSENVGSNIGVNIRG